MSGGGGEREREFAPACSYTRELIAAHHSHRPQMARGNGGGIAREKEDVQYRRSQAALAAETQHTVTNHARLKLNF
ncbi:Hypothetical protein SMAX5B_006711 [Scophthalmus maximus]|uniref:Uncharacterized protein n=1 Tax=Scophthalmus maximus TaxID=52904 RepID=A0A2U9AVG1_SCOMX|nr:Hypothetical protein SMAX5B_006711 [Scophthalmus maximus]